MSERTHRVPLATRKPVPA